MRRGANRVRNIANAEYEAYDENHNREFDQREKARREFARSAGYQTASYVDPFIPYVCPVCAASVTLSAVERHSAWHTDNERTKA